MIVKSKNNLKKRSGKMKGNTKTEPRKTFMYLTMFIIILLTGLLSFILFLSLIKVDTKVIINIYDVFFRHKWKIFTIGGILLVILILAIIMLTKQIELFFEKRIQKMYSELETDTIKGIDRLPIGVLNYDLDGRVIWSNQFFSEIEKEAFAEETIFTLLPELEQRYTETGSLAIISDVETDEIVEKEQYLFVNEPFFGRTVDIYQDTHTKMIYFFDKTNEQQLLEKFENEKLVIGYLYIDAPEEIQVLEDAGDIDASGEIHRGIVNWAKNYNVYIRKYSSYRWMVVTNKENLDQMVADKMNIKDYTSSLGSEQDVNISLSGGFAVYDEDLGETVKEAIKAIELAQSRGGDQVVVRLDEQTQEIFGGDNNQKKRTSRVMVRSTALALHNEINKHDTIYLTGHQFADLDAVGALVGLAEIAKASGKEVKFILDTRKLADGVESLLRKIWREDDIEQEFEEKVILPSKFEADEMPENSLVIVADVATTALFETSEITKVENVIVIDHHRKGQDSLDAPIFEYIDPFSSSTSEMVTELIQYQPESVELTMEVATLLLSGIILDTNKFTRNVSSRTFEAASYLRKKGALQDYVLQVLGTNIDDFITQSYFLMNSEEIIEDGRLLILDDASSRLEIAKCADFLLSFPEVKYTIIVGKLEDGSISMSARSKGTSNIQRVMEHFGGGGHYNNAAAQLDGGNLEEIKMEILSYLDEKQREKTDAHKFNLE